MQIELLIYDTKYSWNHKRNRFCLHNFIFLVIHSNNEYFSSIGRNAQRDFCRWKNHIPNHHHLRQMNWVNSLLLSSIPHRTKIQPSSSRATLCRTVKTAIIIILVKMEFSSFTLYKSKINIPWNQVLSFRKFVVLLIFRCCFN